MSEVKIPEGYKQTEVGAIPKDWEVEPLKSLLKEPPKYGINAAAVPLTGNLPVYIRITDISEDGYYSPEKVVGVNNPFSSSYILNEGDIVLARTGASVGKSYLYRKEDGTLIYAGFLIKVSPNENQLNPKYLHQYLKTEQYWAWVIVNSMRSGQPGINGNEYGRLLIPLPSIEEQTAIATALSDVDNLIGSLEKLIAKKEAIKMGTMQQLLTGKTRLPEFATRDDGSSKGFKQTELGRIPEDWEVSLLSSVCNSFTTGKLDANAMTPNGRYRFYTCAKKYCFINDYAFDMEALLISGNGANVGYIHYFKGKFNAYQRTYVLSDFKSNIFYLKLFLEAKLAERIRVEVNAGNTPYITMDTLTEMLIILPCKLEQTAIATILSDMDAEIQALQQRLEKTKDIKQGMMQQLLTGKVRLLDSSAKSDTQIKASCKHE